MGGNDSKDEPAPPPEPPKSTKELCKEAKKGLDNMIREFKRETFRLEMDSKKIKKDLEKAVKKGEPKTTQRIYAQNFIKKQGMITKYKGLEAKIEGVKIQLANIQTTEQLVDTMGKMGDIMGNAANKIDINNIQNVIGNFNTNMEKQNIMGEMIEDAMDMDDDEVNEDCAADELIDSLASKNKQKGTNLNQEEDAFDGQLAGLKDL